MNILGQAKELIPEIEIFQIGKLTDVIDLQPSIAIAIDLEDHNLFIVAAFFFRLIKLNFKTEVK